ncbi:MAG: TatD family hydrolase [Planctomycetaceae bacterium]
MTCSLIDTHCHLDSRTFHAEIADVVSRALDAGVRRMLTIGISLETSRAAVELAERFECVSAVVGIHPNHVHEVQASDWDDIQQLSQHPQVVGIGETGLDRYWDVAPIELQRDYFRRHLKFSRSSGLPFVVHCREANDDVLEVLRDDFQHGPLNGVMHSFCGDVAMAEECLAMGMFISFAGMVTYKKSDDLRAVARTIPLDRILVETDSPYLAPQPIRGKRNEPAMVTHTAACLAEVHQMSIEAFAQSTTRNATRLFGVEPVFETVRSDN